MTDKLRSIIKRFDEIEELLADNGTIANQEKYTELLKEHASIVEIVTKAKRLEKAAEELSAAKEMLTLPDMADMAREEVDILNTEIAKLNGEIKILLLPKDPNDDKSVILEIRAGTGGEEAALFGMNLLRMYTRYAETHGFKMESLSSNFTELGGVKEVVLEIAGKGAYSRLKYESGVHRVQRVPETESGGRIHTSAATVAVLPEAEDVDVKIEQNDLRIDVFRSGGHGGQSVNTTDSAVRITHIPTGLVVTCQDEKSQLKNKEKALKVLKSRLYDAYKSQAEREYAQSRKSQIGSGDRSERIRTYNYPQNRVTDHRINVTLYKLDAFMEGEIDEMVDALISAQRAQELSSG